MSANETIHTSSTGGQKAGNDVRASLLPWREVLEVAELFGRGAKKYDDHNWRKGYKWSLSFDALHRHLAAWWSGEEFDNGEGGTGLEHLTCVIFHALVLMWFRKHRPEFDDRYATAAGAAEDDLRRRAVEAIAAVQNYNREPRVVHRLTEDCRDAEWMRDTGQQYRWAGRNWQFRIGDGPWVSSSVSTPGGYEGYNEFVEILT